MLNGNSMSLGKRFGWLAAILLAGAGCAAQVGGPEGSVGEDQAALSAPTPMVPVALDVPQTVAFTGLNRPTPGATRAPVDPGASEVGGDTGNGEPQPNPWHGGSTGSDDGDNREPQPNPWLGRKGMDDGDGTEPQPNPWNPVKMPAHTP
jgi:hypothetical protein